MNRFFRYALEAGVVLMCSHTAFGQSSSLLVQRPDDVAESRSVVLTPNLPQAPRTVVVANTGVTPSPQRRQAEADPLIAAVRQHSFFAVGLPAPRTFELQDLVTIVVREDTQATSKSTLDTSKDTKYEGELKNIVDIKTLLTQFTLQNQVWDNNPEIGVEWNNEFKGDGAYTRKDTMTSRVQARIIDIKPNGLLVLEARKNIQSDRETLSLVLTGTCRPDDVTSDNTVLSTQLYDLHLNKIHHGDVRDAARKGVLTRILETILNF